MEKSEISGITGIDDENGIVSSRCFGRQLDRATAAFALAAGAGCFVQHSARQKVAG
jgi:hypothetical protein